MQKKLKPAKTKMDKAAYKEGIDNAIKKRKEALSEQAEEGTVQVFELETRIRALTKERDELKAALGITDEQVAEMFDEEASK